MTEEYVPLFPEDENNEDSQSNSPKKTALPEELEKKLEPEKVENEKTGKTREDVFEPLSKRGPFVGGRRKYLRRR